MGIDISMSMGWGIHIPQSVFDEWLSGLDSGEGGDADEDAALGRVLWERGPDLTYAYAGNSWQGEENGVVFYATDTYKDFDMGREAQAGVYRPPGRVPVLSTLDQFDAVSLEIAGETLTVEWLVTVGVS